MKTLLFFSFLISFAHAEALKMEPGLWEVKMTIHNPDGTVVDPSKAIKEALAKLPEDKRKKMMETMGNVGAVENEGMKVCYTDQMIKNPDFLKQDNKGKCDSKITASTATLVKLTFTCKDGTSGDGVWTVKNPKSYPGTVNVSNPQKKKTAMNYAGNFVQKDCGNLKPSTL